MQPSHSRHSARHQHRSPRHTPAAAAGPRRATGRRAGVRRGGLASRLGWTLALSVVVAGTGAALTSHLEHNHASLSTTASNGSVPLLGASVANAGQLAQNTSQFGHMDVVRVFYPGLPSASAWTSGMAGANKSAVVVSFNAAPSAILSGSDDAALSHFFATAPRTHPIYYDLDHEPEVHIARGEYTAAAFKAAWAHVVALADRANNPELHSTLILMAYDVQRYSHRNWRDYLPAGNVISTIGWDAYPDLGSKALPPSQFMAPAVAAARSAGLPFGFAEFGMYTQANRPQWLAEVGSYLMNSGAVFGTLFDSAAVSPSMDVTDPASVTAWRSYVTASANGVGQPAPSPAPSPAKSSPPSPAPSPAKSSPPSPAPSPAPAITGLGLSSARVTPGGRVAVTFQLSHWANVTVCVLGRNGTVTGTQAQPRVDAGRVQISVSAPGAAGSYRVLVVVSNSHGSSVSERALAVS